MALSKVQLEQENQSNFPDNNQQLITPQLLREFNTDMIDSLVDENTYNADSASWNAQIAYLDPSGSVIALNALEAFTASANLRLNALEQTSQSLNQFTASQYVSNSYFATTGSNTFTGNQTIAKEYHINTNGIYWNDNTVGYNNLEIINSSYGNVDIAAINGRVRIINSPLTLTGSALTSSNDISTSANIYAANLTGSTINTASFATTGSNTFRGTQTISGSVLVSSSIVANIGISLPNSTFGQTIIDQRTRGIKIYNTDNYSETYLQLGQNSPAGGVVLSQQSGKLLVNVSASFTGDVSASGGISSSTINGLGNATLFSASVNSRLLAITGSTIDTGSLVTTASFNAYTASQDFKNTTFATTASVNALSASIYSTDATQSNNINSLTSKTGSYATTGSNTFVGNQTVNGDISASGNISASSLYATNATIVNLTTVYETSSVIYSSGSNQLGDELSDTQILSGSVKVVGGLTVNGVSVSTQSVDITALNAFTASQIVSNSYFATTSSVNDLSASLYFTDTTQSNNIASNSSSIGLLQTFSGSQYKNDSSSFDSRINSITGSGGTINTGSFITTGSAVLASQAISGGFEFNTKYTTANPYVTQVGGGTTLEISYGDIFNGTQLGNDFIFWLDTNFAGVSVTGSGITNGAITGYNYGSGVEVFITTGTITNGATYTFTGPAQGIVEVTGSLYATKELRVNGAYDARKAVADQNGFYAVDASGQVQAGASIDGGAYAGNNSNGNYISLAATSSQVNSNSGPTPFDKPQIAVTQNNNGRFTQISFQGNNDYTNGTITVHQPLFVSQSLSVSGSATFSELTGSLGAYSASVNSRINGIVTGTGFATTGSNVFNGDQYISNGVLQVATYPQTTKQWFSPTAIEAIGTASVAYEQYVDGGGYDAFNLITTLDSGSQFRDLRSDTFALETWLAIPRNTGNNPPPQFKRGLGVTGSVDITGQFTINGVPISGSGGSGGATLGANTFTGSQTISSSLSVVNYQNGGIETVKILPYISSSTFNGNRDTIVTARQSNTLDGTTFVPAATSPVNVIFGTLNPTVSATSIVSGSNNIILNGRVAATNGAEIQSNLSYFGVFPSTRTPAYAGVRFTNSTINNTVTVINNTLGLSSSLALGSPAFGYQTAANINTSLIVGAATLNPNSSSITLNTTINAGNLTVTGNKTNPDFTINTGSGFSVNNTLNLGTTTLIDLASGSTNFGSTGYARNLFGGVITATNILSATASAALQNTIAFGSNLIVTGSDNQAGAGNGGTAFFGRYNLNDGVTNNTSNVVFAVGGGTGTGASARTPLWIGTSQNVNITGSLIVANPSTNGFSVDVNAVVSGSKFYAGNNNDGLLYNASTASLSNSYTRYGKDGFQIYQYQGQPYAFGIICTADQLNAYTGSQFRWGTVNSLGPIVNYMNMVSASFTGSIGGGSAIPGLDYLKNGEIVQFNRGTTFDKNVYIQQGLYVSQSTGGGIPALTLNGTSATALLATGSCTITGSLNLNGQTTFASLGSNTFTGNQVVSASIYIAPNSDNNQLYLPSGSNKQTGLATLDGGNPGTVTVSNTNVTANSIIMLTKQTLTNSHTVAVSSKGSNTFTITSNGNGDSDVVAYMIINAS